MIIIEEYKQEIIEFIETNNLKDIYTIENKFYNEYRHNLYVYIRVSTEKQEFGRQLLELYQWAKNNHINICIDNIFCDKYTGKTLKRVAYTELRKYTKKGDYILISELTRLGRDWDAIKEEWYLLKSQGINILITDFKDLSSPLPNEETTKMNVDRKFMQELTFNAILYASCKKLEEVSRTTKAGVQKARLQGKRIGKPRGRNSSKYNFIKTLKYMVDNDVGQKIATRKTGYPIITFKKDLKKCYDIYNTKNYAQILTKIQGEKKWQLF